MRRYLAVIAAVMVALIVMFVAAEALHVPLLTAPSATLVALGPLAAPVGVALLVADVVLPVPSSLVMIAHGSLFGVVLGTALNLVGTVGAGMFAFFLGRRSRGWLDRLVSSEERARAERMLDRWGEPAVAVTRAVPILAETLALVAGASPMGAWRMLVATLIGALPIAVFYAMVGASVFTLRSILPLVAALVGLAVLWQLDRRQRRRARGVAPPERA